MQYYLHGITYTFVHDEQCHGSGHEETKCGNSFRLNGYEKGGKVWDDAGKMNGVDGFGLLSEYFIKILALNHD